MKKLCLLVMCALLAVAVAACDFFSLSKSPASVDPYPEEPPVSAPAQTPSAEDPQQEEPSATPGNDESDPARDDPADAAPDDTGDLPNQSLPDGNAIAYSDLTGMMFWFGSGVGAWSTEVSIHPDGSFTGYFHDSEMGSFGEDYPNGTCYECHFSGAFSPLEKISDFEYAMKCISLTQEGSPGDEEIRDDGVKYIVSTPYGFDDADEFVLYLPGKSAEDLPEGFMLWVCLPRGIDYESVDVLNFWGLYNVGGEQGFSSEGRQYDSIAYSEEWPSDLPYYVPVYADGRISGLDADSYGNLCIFISNTSEAEYEAYIETLLEEGWEEEDEDEDGDDAWSCALTNDTGDARHSMAVFLVDDITVIIVITP